MNITGKGKEKERAMGKVIAAAITTAIDQIKSTIFQVAILLFGVLMLMLITIWQWFTCIL